MVKTMRSPTVGLPHGISVRTGTGVSSKEAMAVIAIDPVADLAAVPTHAKVGTWIDLWEVLQLHAAGRIVLKTEVHPLDSVNEVLAKLRDGEVTGRAVLVPG
jgi:D-arabinose 1-dehydrogenase-like Zn-dependent alcohol dehydrogenase